MTKLPVLVEERNKISSDIDTAERERDRPTASNDGRKTRGRPFQRGNKMGRGRPSGSRNHATLMLDAIVEGGAEDLLRAVLQQATSGDMRAAELVLSRVWPVRRGRPVHFALPEISTASHVAAALSAVVRSVAEGDLTPDEGAAVAALLETKRRALETQELEQRLQHLEERLARDR